jgi:hypothetical protein
MRALGLSLSVLACVIALIVVAPSLAKSQPSVFPLAFGQTSAGGVEEAGYRYRRYRYARRPYYQPYYRPYAYYQPYYRPYAYYRPYFQPYYPYYYRPYYRPGLSFWFGF